VDCVLPIAVFRAQNALYLALPITEVCARNALAIALAEVDISFVTLDTDMASCTVRASV
jgi:hypothetical protein